MREKYHRVALSRRIDDVARLRQAVWASDDAPYRRGDVTAFLSRWLEDLYARRQAIATHPGQETRFAFTDLSDSEYIRTRGIEDAMGRAPLHGRRGRKTRKRPEIIRWSKVHHRIRPLKKIEPPAPGYPKAWHMDAWDGVHATVYSVYQLRKIWEQQAKLGHKKLRGWAPLDTVDQSFLVAGGWYIESAGGSEALVGRPTQGLLSPSRIEDYARARLDGTFDAALAAFKPGPKSPEFQELRTRADEVIAELVNAKRANTQTVATVFGCKRRTVQQIANYARNSPKGIRGRGAKEA
jgi:hypothetical protein